MRSVRAVLPFLLVTAATACSSTGKPATRSDTLGGGATPAAKERPGVFLPADAEAVSIWTEAYSGELLVNEVVPHGTSVSKGDVIARLETRTIDDQIHAAELEARSAVVREQGVAEKNKIDDDAAAATLEAARASLDRARKSLEGWREHEVPFSRRGDAISKKWEDAGIDDQKDELAQLQKMYEADELVDDTEEIVLKRSIRRLGISEESRTLSNDRRAYRVEYDEAMQTQIKEEAVRTQELALDRLARSQAIDRRAREDALTRATDAREQQEEKLAKLRSDRELLTVRAPRDGVLLHGKEKDFRPGRTPSRWERGSTLSYRSDLFLVGDPDTLAVAFDVPESMLSRVEDGMAVDVRPVSAPGEDRRGTVRLEAYPAPRTDGNDNVHEARIELVGPIDGVLFGMRAQVMLGKAAGAAPSAPSP